MKTKEQWQASGQTLAKYVDTLEFQTGDEWHHFEVLSLPDRLLFGGWCNVGFLESGFILREDGEALDETLCALWADLEVYYQNGPSYVSRIVCNERM